MHPATQTFWLEETGQSRFGLRRYSSLHSDYTCEGGWHDTAVDIGNAPTIYADTEFKKGRYIGIPPTVPHDDSRWPTVCEKCGYQFTVTDHWQETQHVLYKRVDTDELFILREAPAGAMWNAWWMPDNWHGSDGIALQIRLANNLDWHVDSQASNCTRPGEPHKCWVRHGDPRKANLTVDKSGETCAAGAGSIMAGDYHGFLQNGILTAG